MVQAIITVNYPVQDITVGNPAKAQLARAVRNPEEAFNLMKGNFFVVETKFDGRLHIPALTPTLWLLSCTKCADDRSLSVLLCPII